jgi:hypothetical protein
MGSYAERLASKMNDPEFREGYEEASCELEEHCIVFNWHGDAPNKGAGDLFAEEALNMLIEIAERHGCHVGGGFEISHDPCGECARLTECPFGSECVTCHPPYRNAAGFGVVHIKRPTITGFTETLPSPSLTTACHCTSSASVPLPPPKDGKCPWCCLPR